MASLKTALAMLTINTMNVIGGIFGPLTALKTASDTSLAAPVAPARMPVIAEKNATKNSAISTMKSKMWNMAASESYGAYTRTGNHPHINCQKSAQQCGADREHKPSYQQAHSPLPIQSP